MPVWQTHIPVAGTQTWPVGQVFGVPSWQVPLLHVSVVQRLLSALHGVPLATNRSGGHWPEVPVQVSATSHGPTAARHTVVAGSNVLGGHAAATPVQVESFSHGPTAEAQTNVEGLN